LQPAIVPLDTSKAIWIDLDNSPHVPLFAPIIRHYRALGVEVVLTARDHSQTLELLELHGFGGTYEVIGRHHGGHTLNKIAGTLARARELSSYIRSVRPKHDISVALSHGSRTMVLAARWLGIPVLTMYDYEFTETRIFNLFSDKVLVPQGIPDNVLDGIGLRKTKRIKYDGIKEELYMRYFEPQPGFRESLLEKWSTGPAAPVIAVLRPPATTANYHEAKSEVLFDDLLQFLLSARDVLMVVVPRTADQAQAISDRIRQLPAAQTTPYVVLTEAIDGSQLAYASDLLISGGGTMNREAALLGVPVYSIFAGRQGALDRQMEADGLITFIRDARDLSKIRLERRERRPTSPLTDRVETFVIKQIDSFRYPTNEI
jgi:predicted glycosyltransferase